MRYIIPIIFVVFCVSMGMIRDYYIKQDNIMLETWDDGYFSILIERCEKVGAGTQISRENGRDIVECVR